MKFNEKDILSNETASLDFHMNLEGMNIKLNEMTTNLFH